MSLLPLQEVRSFPIGPIAMKSHARRRIAAAVFAQADGDEKAEEAAQAANERHLIGIFALLSAVFYDCTFFGAHNSIECTFNLCKFY